MKILVFGTGGVGGYFGGRLAQAGHEVTFIARGAHLEAIKQNGLQLKSIDGDFLLKEVCVTANPKELKPNFDLILLGVKSWQVAAIIPDIKALLQGHTLVLPLQNSVAHIAQLQEAIPAENLLGGFCRIYAKVEAPGVINHFGFPPELIFGNLTQVTNDKVEGIKGELEKASFKTTLSQDVLADMWKKYIFINTVSGLGALTRVSIGAMFENEGTRTLLHRTIEEMLAVAKALRINLPDGFDQTMLSFIESQPYKATASTQRDIMEGRPSELENFNGYIVKQGKKLGVSTPVNTFIYNCLLPQEQIARGLK